DAFFQIKNPERDRSKGTGLGLAICKRLIDAIGCTISVKSQVEKWTTFTIQIPPELIVDARDDEEQPPAADAETDGLSGLRMLVVEDHETTRLAVTALLSARGATVDQAEDGRSALRMLRHSTPDVVLLDLMLPDMD